MAMAKELQWLDDRFFQSLSGKDSCVVRDHDDAGEPIPLEFMSKQGFLDQMAGKVVVEITVGKGQKAKQVKKDATEMWLRHQHRRQYWGVEFDPANNSGRKYNMWKGFAVEAKQGDWSLFRRHIETVLCQEQQELIDFTIGWLARAVQLPWVQAETALVMRGGKGTGKGTFANIFGALFGPHYLAVSNKQHLIGRFNSHLQDKVIMFVDEGFWAGDVQNEGTLKQLITEPTIPIEAKFQDVTNAPNRLHVIMASNERWVVPASGMERRFFVLDLVDDKAQDMGYFGAIRKQMHEQGGLSAMLYDLQQYDLSQFNPHIPPMTKGLGEQMLHSLKGLDSWWYGKLCDGKLVEGQSGWGKKQVEFVYEDYAQHERRAVNKQQFLLGLRGLCPEMQIIESKAGGHGVNMLKLPPLEECRAEWAKKHPAIGEWNGQ